MFNFPEYSDLGGLKGVDRTTQGAWAHMLAENEKRQRYYDGEVFDETVPFEAGNSEDAPLLYPVGANIVKMIVTAITDSTYGEWTEAPITWGVRKDHVIEDADVEAIALANSILEISGGAKLLWEHDLDRNLFGGGAIKISPYLAEAPYIKWSRISRDSFFPVFDPDDIDTLLEAWVITTMTPEQAKAKYGIEKINKQFIQRVEHWTRSAYTTKVDDTVVNEFSGINPWGFVPFIYNPRFRSLNWWGEALVDDLISLQDEVNMRLADIGEAINYNSHPTRFGINLPREFNADNFPLAPNAMWNLGRQVGGLTPEVGMLEAKAAVQPGVFEYINFVFDFAQTSSMTPPIAFGKDDGGGQRSGITLEIRLWPLIKAMKRSRSYLGSGFSKALRMSAAILKQKGLNGISKSAIDSILKRNLVPLFASVMPQDRPAIVDEVVKLLSTDPPSISLQTAQDILGRGAGEVERIEEMMKNKDIWKAIVTAQEEAKKMQIQKEQKREKPE